MAIDPNTGAYVPTPQTTITAPPPVVAPAPPTASTVYSAPNIQQAITAPVAPPNLSDPMGINDYYMNTPEMQAAQANLTAAQTATQQASATARARQTAIEQNPLESMGFIVGAQSRAGQLDAQQLQALAEAQNVAQSSYLAQKETAQNRANIALQQRAELTNLIVNNPGAGITYMDTPESAAKKMETFRVQQEKITEEKAKQAAKDKEKSDLKAQALALGLKTSGSRKELEKRIAKAAKADKAKANIIEDLKIAQAKKDLAKPYYEPKEDTKINIDKSDKGIAALIEQGVNSGDSWGDIAATLTAAGIGTQSGSLADRYLRFKFGADSTNPLD